MFDSQEFEKSSLYSLEVLSQENALARITEEYGTLEDPKFDYIDISLDLSATYQQLAAKPYHAFHISCNQSYMVSAKLKLK